MINFMQQIFMACSTGIPTSLCSIADVICPHNKYFQWTVRRVFTPAVYTNCLLVTLNARDHIRNGSNGFSSMEMTVTMPEVAILYVTRLPPTQERKSATQTLGEVTESKSAIGCRVFESVVGGYINLCFSKLPIATHFDFNCASSTRATGLEAFIPPLGPGLQGALEYDAPRHSFLVISLWRSRPTKSSPRSLPPPIIPAHFSLRYATTSKMNRKPPENQTPSSTKTLNSTLRTAHRLNIDILLSCCVQTATLKTSGSSSLAEACAVLLGRQLLGSAAQAQVHAILAVHESPALSWLRF
ncbi:hypothetical protein B0H14DRAFT_2643074 [Mycena olivaceomarginata]|nr:hypothetical protein B0H14DRAFT_2643074 [Mycena olivaceomarginata]